MGDYIDLPVYGGLWKTVDLPPNRFYLPHDFKMSLPKTVIFALAIGMTAAVLILGAGWLLVEDVDRAWNALVFVMFAFGGTQALTMTCALTYDLLKPFSVTVTAEGIRDPRISPDVILWADVASTEIFSPPKSPTIGIWLILTSPARIKSRPFRFWIPWNRPEKVLVQTLCMKNAGTMLSIVLVLAGQGRQLVCNQKAN
jgi:hypothetical protein